jgi:VCBS repeat-containing protein
MKEFHVAILHGTNKAERIDGTSADDRLFGENGNDSLFGGAGADYIDGGNGSDLIDGGAGNDVIDGGNGQDTLLLAGNRADYHFWMGDNGAVIVRDRRPNGPDGTDRLFNMERVQFADGTFKLVDLITAANAVPVAVNDALTLVETAGAANVTATLLANDSDAEGSVLKVSAVQGVSAKGATVTLTPEGQVIYDAGEIFAALNDGETATDTFTYTITDAAGLTSTATATVTINGFSQNAAPAAADDQLSVADDAGATDVTAILLANDSDPDGDPLTVTAVQALSAKGAAVTLSADGKVVYNPGAVFLYLEEGESETDTFTYTVTDAGGLTSTATATVTVTGTTRVPDFYFAIAEDESTGNMLALLSDILGFQITGVDSTGTVGTVTFTGDSLVFAADSDASDYLRPDSHEETYFTVTGENGRSGLIEMSIYGINDDIFAVDDAIALGEGGQSGDIYQAVILNDKDLDADALTRKIMSVDSSETLGQVTFDPEAKSLNYSAAGIDLAAGETLTDSFTYMVTDGYGSVSTGTVTVTLTGSEGDPMMSMSRSSAPAPAPASAFVAEGAEAAAGSFADLGIMQAQEILGADILIG